MTDNTVNATNSAPAAKEPFASSDEACYQAYADFASLFEQADSATATAAGLVEVYDAGCLQDLLASDHQ